MGVLEHILALSHESLDKFAHGQAVTEALAIGLSMGLINLAGCYTSLKALSIGPLSIVIAIIGLHFVTAILLSVMIYEEKLTPPIMAGISLTILSVILLRH